MKPVKQSVAVVVFAPHDRRSVLIVQRPPDDQELPNAWGLPAASLQPGESVQAAVRRTGTDKLGVSLRPLRELQLGAMERTPYRLEMRLIEAEIEQGSVAVPQPIAGVTQYQGWKWGTAEELRPAAALGSLCCRLFLAE